MVERGKEDGRFGAESWSEALAWLQSDHLTPALPTREIRVSEVDFLDRSCFAKRGSQLTMGGVADATPPTSFGSLRSPHSPHCAGDVCGAAPGRLRDRRDNVRPLAPTARTRCVRGAATPHAAG